MPRWALAVGILVVAIALGSIGSALGWPPHVPGPGGPVLSVLLSPLSLAVLGLGFLGFAFAGDRDLGLGYRFLVAAPGVWILAAAAASVDRPAALVILGIGAAFQVGWFALLLQYTYRHKQMETRLMRLLLELSAASIAVSAGWFLWALDRSALALGVAVAVAIALGLRGMLAPARPTPGEERIPWLLRPFWVFQLLLYTFLAEFFLGALLDYAIAGPGFLGYIPFLPMVGGNGTLVLRALYDALWFGAAILASAWFLVALGFTMGALVVLRMREVHHAAQRYRMALMLGVFALAAVFLPSLASSTPLVSNQVLASLPIIGWGFGLRSGGPFEAGIFLAVLVMYACVGVLTVLFGRKALCAVMCGAALMYQGTTVHEMRGFHQTSTVGQYFLGSRLTTAYVVASVMALSSLFAVSLLAFLGRLPSVQVANGAFDTSALPLPIELYFGGIWFVLFVSTPYLGTYNCASTGFCHWGSLSVPFAKVSFFRLKVKDKAVCQACTTFDCAKSCPVGLVDMPVAFRTKGEYRSTKCCGVGDCVDACPYGNLYHQDVRFWLLRGFRRLTTPPTPQLLPMAKSTSPVPKSAGPEVATGGLGPTPTRPR